ncbi:hypothetical protein Dvina_01635 [Dactylosporangium vinaceum]|uniref:Cytochrome P450 n=1 Tax=Dactylosporangium vinaceum TaxID=53362 RepID=A0ABV5MLH9_9ACTN|nr:cytochrome P450 [Dactylosporangium vinaceum]UAB96956.1 hypothetical protein Dvina_01635 [Dactylosporangium vinaceum]
MLFNPVANVSGTSDLRIIAGDAAVGQAFCDPLTFAGQPGSDLDPRVRELLRLVWPSTPAQARLMWGARIAARARQHPIDELVPEVIADIIGLPAAVLRSLNPEEPTQHLYSQLLALVRSRPAARPETVLDELLFWRGLGQDRVSLDAVAALVTALTASVWDATTMLLPALLDAALTATDSPGLDDTHLGGTGHDGVPVANTGLERAQLIGPGPSRAPGANADVDRTRLGGPGPSRARDANADLDRTQLGRGGPDLARPGDTGPELARPGGTGPELTGPGGMDLEPAQLGDLERDHDPFMGAGFDCSPLADAGAGFGPARVADSDSDRARLVESVLRNGPGVIGWLRTTTQAVLLDGELIPAGQRCLLLVDAEEPAGAGRRTREPLRTLRWLSADAPNGAGAMFARLVGNALPALPTELARVPRLEELPIRSPRRLQLILRAAISHGTPATVRAQSRRTRRA